MPRQPGQYWYWRSSDQHRALEEGWCIIRSHRREEIQRDDDQAKFKTDDAAMKHVKRCAKAGSELHKRALRHVEAARKGKED